MMHRQVLGMLIGTLALGCGPLRIGGDPAILALSGLQVDTYCRSEEKFRAISGEKPADDFGKQCTIPVDADARTLRDAENNRIKEDLGSLEDLQSWEARAALDQGAHRPTASLDFLRRQISTLDAFGRARVEEREAMTGIVEKLHTSATKLRRNASTLHDCFNLSVGGALLKAVQFDFEPITDQCAIDADVLRDQIDGLNDAQKAYGDALDRYRKQTQGTPKTPAKPE